MPYGALLLSLALAGQPYDPMGLVAEPQPAPSRPAPSRPSPGRPATLPANESPRGLAAQRRALAGRPPPGTVASPYGEKLMAEAPTTALAEPLVEKYLLCASIYTVNLEISELMMQVHPKDAPDRLMLLEMNRRQRVARDDLLRRGRELAPAPRKAAYDRLKPVAEKWAWQFSKNGAAAFIPRQLGCWGLPEVAAQFPPE